MYASASVLLLPASTLPLPGISSSAARERASTKENPSSRCFFSDSLKGLGSSSIISMILSVRQCGVSAPNDRCETEREAARMSTAPFAKTPALCAEKMTGSSRTRSVHMRARLQRASIYRRAPVLRAGRNLTTARRRRPARRRARGLCVCGSGGLYGTGYIRRRSDDGI